MHDVRLQNLLNLARSGDQPAREELLRTHRSYIAQVASSYCGRPLEWENDDELSISLLAFNEAIDSYDPLFGKAFRHYARLVIRNRLIDHFRKEGRHRHLSLEGSAEEGEEMAQWEREMAWRRYLEDQAARERAEEMACFAKALETFGISMTALELSSPKHRDTRETLVGIARWLASQRELAAYVKQHRRLPLKEISRATGVSRKVLKHGRQYILALFLLVSGNDFPYLRSLFSLSLEAAPGKGKGAADQAIGSKGDDPR